MVPAAIRKLSQEVITKFTEKGLMITTAESCTGGLIAGALTEISGSSAVVERGFVTYSNEAKAELLDVDMPLIIEHGAVSEPVARAMVLGAIAKSRATVGIAVTGIAGPGGGSAEKPVGLVYIAAQKEGHEAVVSRETFGDIGREEVRLATVEKALLMLLDQLDA